MSQDLAGFVALGDPAVTLPLAPGQLRAAAVAREPEPRRRNTRSPPKN